MKLLIVESPAKAKTISKYLDDKYTVKASVGHVRDLPKSSKNAIDIKKGFVPKYEISVGKEKVIKELRKLSKEADEIVLASDPDREGEAIAWHLVEALKLKDDPRVKRITFNEITKTAVNNAIEHPREIDMNLKSAQEARRVLDRLVGYDLSGLIWKKVRYGLSAGRVQSPALRIIMEKEREIRKFISEDYWVITADVESTKTKNDVFLLTCQDEPRNKDLVDKILSTGEKEDWVVEEIKETKAQRKPYAPFKTSTIQQTASTRLGFSPSRTMSAAQKLYEAGHITYMRTDSIGMSDSANKSINEFVLDKYGKEYSNPTQYKTKSKNAQEAHEAIRPTKISKLTAGTTDDQKALYRLIWIRTVTSQMKPAEILRTKINVRIGSGDIPDFYVNGSRTLFDGWLKVDTEAKGEDVELPKINKGEKVNMKKMHVEDKQTQPPNRYTEAGLVKELEKRGIGRPSTYASIMRTLEARGYVTKEGKTLFPTDTGDVVSSFLEEHFKNYISDTFTAEMEDELDDIAEGKRQYKKTLKDFYTPFLEQIESKADIPKITNLGKVDAKYKCPKCEKSMHLKLGRGGKFMSCDDFPECDGARTAEGHEIKADEPIGKYPETGEDIYLLTGRFGPYVQVGQISKDKKKTKQKPKRASVPKDKDLSDITIEDALKYLSIPRVLGVHPETGKNISASIGRFGPYIAHDTEPKPDYRSLKTDDVYEITLERALEIFAEPKKTRKKAKKK